MADKRISQLVDRGTVANNDVVPIVVSGASTTNKATISSIQTFMQGNLDMGVTSVGLSMPSAFMVSNSPVTASGNISVTGAGTVSQYIRGDGSLADFPSGGGGGGASVNYYLNGSVSQGTIGGIAYQEMNKVPVLGAGTDFTIAADGYIASFITDAGDPALLQIPAGNWNFETYLQASSGGGTPTFYIELYKVDSGGTATLIASNSGSPELIAFGTTTTPYFSALAVPTTSLTLTDRLALRYYVTHSGRTITLHTENATLCQIITTFTTGLTALNGLTAQVQNFATGTSGTDFGITSSVSTHTFNLPTASASNRGALSSADFITFNSKIGGTISTGQVAFGTAANTVGGDNGLFWDNTNKRLGVGTNSPSFNLQVNGSVRFGSSTTLENNTYFDNTNFRLGIGVMSPTRKLDVSDNGSVLVANFRSTSGNISAISLSNNTSTADQVRFGSNGSSLTLYTNFTEKFRIFSNGNVVIQDAGTFTDNGFRLDVNGTARVQGVLTTTADAVVNGVSVGRGGGAIATNTRVGDAALLNNTTGSNNTASGFNALRDSTTGSNNTASGVNALRNNTTGSNNTASGFEAGRYIAVGTVLTIANNSVFLGFDTRAAANNQTNQIVIGHTAIGLGSNTTVIGNASTTFGRWFGNLLLGTSTNIESSIFTMASTTQGFLPPRMTAAQRAAIATPAEGLVVVQTDGTQGLYLYIGAAWHAITML